MNLINLTVPNNNSQVSACELILQNQNTVVEAANHMNTIFFLIIIMISLIMLAISLYIFHIIKTKTGSEW